MSQQFKNGSRHDGSVTLTVRDTYRYAVVNDPFTGKHKSKTNPNKRKFHWAYRNLFLPKNTTKYKEAASFLNIKE